MGVPAAALVVLGLAAVVAVASGLRRVGASERLVVRRFGRLRGVRGPGLRYLLPLADTGVLVPLDERPHRVWFKAATRDGVPVRGTALVMMGPNDPIRYAEAADHPSAAAHTVVEIALRGAIASRTLADLPSLLTDEHTAELARHVAEAAHPWGLTARLISITDATIPITPDRPRTRERE